MQVIRASEYRRMRWKNGLGETAEIAIYPDGAPLDRFDWRISMARVEAPGPFSTFTGIDRTLTVLDGAGFSLAIDARLPVALTPHSAPCPFRGESDTTATLLSGAVTDLNVMTRRGRYWHRVRRLARDERPAIEPRAVTALLFCVAGAVRLDAGGDTAELGPLDAALIEPPAAPLQIAATAPISLLWIEIGRH